LANRLFLFFGVHWALRKRDQKTVIAIAAGAARLLMPELRRMLE
jgi:hypothetical protein